jgi:hypothetical protein
MLLARADEVILRNVLGDVGPSHQPASPQESYLPMPRRLRSGRRRKDGQCAVQWSGYIEFGRRRAK